MKLVTSAFRVHDISQFPLVFFLQEQAVEGYATQWQEEVELLLDNNQPFVLIYDQLRAEESHADRKHRGLWLKKNKNRLDGACKGMISIEPDVQTREQVQKMAEGMVKAFGIPHQAVADLAAAQQQVDIWLSVK